MKKVSKVEQFENGKVVEVGNMYLTGSSLAHRDYSANCTCTTIVHHVTGEKFQLFDFFVTFFVEMARFAVLPIKNR